MRSPALPSRAGACGLIRRIAAHSTFLWPAASRLPVNRGFEHLADPVDAAGAMNAGASMSATGPSRAQRLLGGWSANLSQLVLSVTQQLALVPLFLHYGSGEMLAA